MPWATLPPRTWVVRKAAPNPYSQMSIEELQEHQTILNTDIKYGDDDQVAEAKAKLKQVNAAFQAKVKAAEAAQAAAPTPPTKGPAGYVPTYSQAATPAALASLPPTPKKLHMATSDWQVLLDEADDQAPAMAAALEHAFTWEQLPMDVRLAILAGDASAAVTHLTTALEGALHETYLPSFTAIAEDLFTAVVQHQTPYALELFSALKPTPAPMATHFADDLLAPRAIEYIQQEGLKQIKGFVTTSMEGIRPILMASVADGTPIPKVVQQITPLLALGPHQVKTLSNYAATIQGLPQEQFQAKLNAMHVTLRRRRARVIARTETLRALNVGIDAFWNIAPLAAGLPQTALRRFWMITNDSKTCPHCQPIPGLNPQGVGLDEPFKTPQGPSQRPPLHPQCRCVLAVRPTALAAPELLAPKPMPSTPLFPAYVPETVVPPPPPLPTPAPPKVKKPPKAKAPGPFADKDLPTLQFLQEDLQSTLGSKSAMQFYTDDQIKTMKTQLKQINAEIKLKVKAQMLAPTPSAPPSPPPPPPAPDPYATMSPMQLAAKYDEYVTAFNSSTLQQSPTVLAELKLQMQQIAGHLKAAGGQIPRPDAPAPPPPPPAPAMVSQSWGPSDLAPSWATTPPPAFWAKTPDKDLGTLPAYPGGKVSTGVVMIEDGKIWVYEPKNHYGGYHTAFPKGQVEQGLSPQQNALKEVWEETGLHAEITGFLGDFKATSGTTRLYLGTKKGGNPTKFADETWSVKLLTPDDLHAAFEDQGQAYPKAALQALVDKGLIKAPSGYVAPLAPVPPPQAAAPPPPAPPPAKLPNVTTPLEEGDVRGEFVQKLGGSTGAELWRGTDGKLRAIKRPDKDQAYQEVLANRLYRELGIEAPAQQLVMQGGKIVGVASDWVENTQTLSKAGLTKARAEKVLEGFAADVWLANYDSVGLTMDNILVSGSKLIRIDNGGSLQYRAQGTPKAKDQLGKIDQWTGSLNPQLNASYAAVFREAGLKSADAITAIKGQIQQILDLRATTNNYADLVPAAPGITAAKRKELVKLLQDRASLLEQKLAELSPQLKGTALAAALKQVMGSTYQTMARQSQGKGPATMDEHERVAVYAYTTEDGRFSYHTMNPVYWHDWSAKKGGRPAFSSAAEQAAEKQRLEPLNQSAIDGLAKLPGMKKGATAYHGQRHMTDDQLAAVSSKGEFTFESFASTSTRESVTYNFGGRKHLFIIKSLGGNRDVRGISAYGHESEFLYPPTARFRMIEDYWNGEQHVYKVEELPPVSKREPVQKQEPAFEPPDLPPWTKWVDEYGEVQQMAWGDDAPAGEFAAFAEALLERANNAQLSPEEEAMVRRFARKMDSAGLYVEDSPAFEPPPAGEEPPVR